MWESAWIEKSEFIGDISPKYRISVAPINDFQEYRQKIGQLEEDFKKSPKKSPIFQYFYREISRYFLPVQPAHRIQNLSIFFLKKDIRCYLVIWSWFAGKGFVFQPGSKIVDLGFVKFKSNGTTAKQTQKTEGAKEKQFFGFPWRFCMDFLGNQTRMNFPGNRMGDGFSWESNGGCKNNNNNMIRLVPARIESGRGK